MCGICGIVDMTFQGRNKDPRVIESMVSTLQHRGPDGKDYYQDENISFGFSRLSIIDLAGGMQPVTNEDGSILLVCNGEIFNYKELREQLLAKGHVFRTHCDVEVIVHLYEDAGAGLLDSLNGQFAFALFDRKKRVLLCARDHFGIAPFHYTIIDGFLVFASEIKALLLFPGFKKEVDLTGLDQVFSFPGLISQRTMFKDVISLKNGHYLRLENGSLQEKEYWDLLFPTIGDQPAARPEEEYIEELDELITDSIRLRLRSDVPVGLYLSGGLDSSLIAGKAKALDPGRVQKAYSIIFRENDISEEKYQTLVARQLGLEHHQQLFFYSDITERLPKAIYHCECPIKETYNTASMMLSRLVRDHDQKVILSGEGADELFAGYVGYRFDKMRQMSAPQQENGSAAEEAIRTRLWGDKDFFYEKNKGQLTQSKIALYSEKGREKFGAFDCLYHSIVDPCRLKNRHIINKRSYLDYKLRLVDHLVSDHGDRMALANSVEVRYPFLDKRIAEFSAALPADMKLQDFEEKYILKKVAAGTVPREIVEREKFGFVAPGSPYILKRNIEYINDLLSYETIKRQGYFDPARVQSLVREYSSDGFHLNMPFDTDFLLVVLTFGIFLGEFGLPDLS